VGFVDMQMGIIEIDLRTLKLMLALCNEGEGSLYAGTVIGGYVNLEQVR
jgi:hypothetical protein